RNPACNRLRSATPKMSAAFASNVRRDGPCRDRACDLGIKSRSTRRRGDCRLFLGLYQHRSFIQIVVTCVARPAAPEIDHLASKSLDGLVDFAFRPLWMGCRLHDKPVSPPYTFPFDLGQVSRFDQVETVERAVPAIAR